MLRLRELLGKLRFRSLQRGDYTSASERPVENLDAVTAARTQDANPFGGDAGTIPPGYVKSYDESRPRK